MLNAVIFESVFLENKIGQFVIEKLPNDLQMSPIYSFAIDDFNKDGISDFIAGGNFYSNQINIGKCDASYGHLLTLNNNDDKLMWNTLNESGFAIDGEVRDIKILKGSDNQKWIIVSFNDKRVEVFNY
jgi:hypothetical protein